MTPPQIWCELFDTYGSLSSISKEFLTDLLHGYGCEVDAISESDNNATIDIEFSSIIGLSGVLSIDRVEKTWVLKTMSQWGRHAQRTPEAVFNAEGIADNLRQQIIAADRYTPSKISK